MFTDKTVIVTGGAKGIGKAVAKAFAAEGADTIIIDWDQEAGEEAVKNWNQQNWKTAFFQADVGKIEDIPLLLKEIMKSRPAIDVLINNAGLSLFKSIWDITKDDWDKMLTTNAASQLFWSREAAKYMSRGGSIVNMCSTRQNMSEANTELYSASKGAVYSLTHALAMTLSEKNIRVNSISPGWIATEDYSSLRPKDHAQHPAGRVGKPEDIARACLYLSDPENTFITGENLVIDGGMTRKMIYHP